jgi:hypothetical protein
LARRPLLLLVVLLVLPLRWSLVGCGTTRYPH